MKIGVIMVYKPTLTGGHHHVTLCVFLLLFFGEDIYIYIFLDIIDIINDLFKLGVKNHPKKMNISLTCSIFIHIYNRFQDHFTLDVGFFVAETHASAGR
jgi:hypothetical protein